MLKSYKFYILSFVDKQTKKILYLKCAAKIQKIFEQAF